MNEYRAEQNARLLYGLCQATGATGLGAIFGFFDVEPTWRCPCCYRSKPEIARLDKNNNLLCQIVGHHDHFDEHISSLWSVTKQEPGLHAALRESLTRFPAMLICSDCNVAEPAAKRIVGAPVTFSFAPYEIASFIRVKANAPHEIIEERVHAAYAAAKPAMQLIAERVRSAVRAREVNEAAWEPLNAALFRVLVTIKTQVPDK